MTDQLDIPAVVEDEEAKERARKEREASIERQQVEIVFSLGGGELDCADWTYEDAEGVKRTIPYYYEGVPDYTQGDKFDRSDSRSGRYRTIIVIGNPYSGLPATPVGWRHVAFYSTSGEGDCFCNDADESGMIERGAADYESVYTDDGRCPLCECENDGEHHSVYLGDGWGERVIEQPYYERTPGMDDAWHFLGSVIDGHTGDRIELFRAEGGDGEEVFVGRYGDEWHHDVYVSKSMIRLSPTLVDALPWIKEAESRYAQDLADEKG